MARVAVREGTFRILFMNASREVLNFRAEFNRHHTEAKTDAEKWRLEKHFIAHLPTLYQKVDEVLDNYNAWKARTSGW